MKLSQLNDGDFFTMGGEIYQRSQQTHHSRSNTVEIARLIMSDEIPNSGMLFSDILKVSEDTEVTPGTVKLIVDFTPSE